VLSMDKNISDIISKLENILKEIDEKVLIANEGYLKNEKAKDFIIKVSKELDELFSKDPIQYNKYLALIEKKNIRWWEEEKTIFVTENNSRYRRLVNYHDIVKEMLKIYDPKSLFKNLSKQNTYHYSQGDSYSAQRMVIKIMKSANNSIVIIDPYLDDTIFDYIDLIDTKIYIKLVTSKVKKMFEKLLYGLMNIRENVNAKKSEGFHDRYIIIDEKEIWSLGTSINYIGKNAFDIGKITDKEAIDKIMKDCNLWWENGKSIN